MRDGVDLASRIAKGSVIVRCRVEKIPGKAYVEVLERLRGPEQLPPVLRVAYRGVNRMRAPGEPPFELAEGATVFLVLEPWLDSRDEWPDEGLYRPAAGHRSVIEPPAEGGEALASAVRSLVQYEDDPDRLAAEERLRDWLVGQNPWLIDIALDQAARFALAEPDWVPSLLRRMADASPQRRRLAAEALGLALRRRRLDGAGGEHDALRTLSREGLVRLARSDPEPGVRASAVRQLAGSDLDAWPVIEAIAREDPEQTVRYEAAAALQRHRVEEGE